MKIDIFALFVVFHSYFGYGYDVEKQRRTQPACIDTRPDCSNFKKMGWCPKQAKIMKKICRKTCQFCAVKKGCVDKRKDCQYLYRIGYCSSHETAMRDSCARTCGLCKKNKPTTAPARQAKAPAQKLSSCKDKLGKSRCQYYRYIGWCERPNMKYYCKKSCYCERKDYKTECNDSKYGCCWDNKTPKSSSAGYNCPKCEDDERFANLCRRFKTGCRGKQGLGQSLRKHCARTCKLC